MSSGIYQKHLYMIVQPGHSQQLAESLEEPADTIRHRHDSIDILTKDHKNNPETSMYVCKLYLCMQEYMKQRKTHAKTSRQPRTPYTSSPGSPDAP